MVSSYSQWSLWLNGRSGWSESLLDMRGSRKLFSEGIQLWQLFFKMRGSKYHYKRPIIGPQRNAISMAFRWRANDDPTLNASFVIIQGIRTSISQKPYIFVIFPGGGGFRPPFTPPQDPRLLDHPLYSSRSETSRYHTDSLFTSARGLGGR